MRWPFTKTVTVKHEGLDALTAALNRIADAQAGLIERPVPPEPPRPPLAPADVVFLEWLASKGWDDIKTRHFKGVWDIFLGRRAAEGPFTRAVAREFLSAEGAPLPETL